jgi:hypothetical protein
VTTCATSPTEIWTAWTASWSRRTPSPAERKRGNFQHGSRAFLHFHADGDNLYADVRLDGVDFARRRDHPDEQADLVTAIAAEVGD